MKKALSMLLAVTMILSVFALPVMAENSDEIAKLNKSEYISIPLDSAANCHIFEPQGQTVEGISDPTSTLYTSGTRDYINDYMQTYWYNSSEIMGADATDTDSKDKNGNSPYYTWDHFPIYYRTSTSFSGSYLTVDANSNWTVPYLCADGETVKELPYKIDTSKDIIKLVGAWNTTYQKLTEKAKAAYSEKNKALRNATLDIANDNFKNIYILASKGRYQNSAVAAQYFTADVYYEGETEPVPVQLGLKKANVSSTDAELASVAAVFNKIAQLKNPDATTYTNSYSYPSYGYAADSTWYSYEIPCDISKKVDKIKFNVSLGNCNILILSALGEKQSIKDLIDAVESTEVDALSYEAQLAVYNKIKAEIEKAELNLEVADAEAYATFTALENSIKAYEKLQDDMADAEEKEKYNKVSYKDIPFGAAAKSHIFEEYNTSVTGIDDPTTSHYTEDGHDYVYDWLQSIWYDSSVAVGVDAEDSSKYTWAHYPVYYKKTSTHSTSYIPLDENNNWTLPYLEADGETVKYLTYNIKPTEKVIQLAGAWDKTYRKLTEKAEAAYREKNNDMRSATVDVENEIYKNIYILATKGYNQTSALAGQYFTADVYYEGEANPVNVQLPMKKTDISSTDADLASLCAIFNKITGLNHTKSWQHNSSVGYTENCTWYSYEIPCDISKKVDKVALKVGSNGAFLTIISAVGEKASVKDMLSSISSTEVNIENYESQLEAYNKIKLAIESADLNLEAADKAAFAKFTALENNIKVYEENKETSETIAKINKATYTDIPFGDAANAHVFEAHGTTIEGIDDPTSELYTSGSKDYVFDYAQNYWYDGNKQKKLGVDATDGDLYTWTHKPVYYKKTSTHSQSYIPLDENNNWTVPYVDGEEIRYLTYNLKPDQKAISLAGAFLSGYQQLTEKATEKYVAKQANMRKAVVDVENDNYNSLYMLLTTGIYGTGTAPENFTAEIYYEGEQETKIVELGLLRNNILSTEDSITAKFNAVSGVGNDQIWDYNSSMGYASAFGWYTYEIPCDLTKKVDKIVLRISVYNKFVTIASMLGEKPSVKDVLAKVETTEITPVTYRAQKEKLNMIDAIAEKDDINLELAGGEVYEKYNSLKANIEAYEEIKHTLNPTATLETSFYKNETPSVKVNVFNPSETAGKLYTLIFAYYDAEGNYIGADVKPSSTLAEESYSYIHKAEKAFENTKKVKAFVWDGFENMKPIGESAETEETNAFKVLSIGNSFSQGVHTYLAEFAKDAGYEKIICGNLYIGGCSLDLHYSNIINNKASYEFHVWELKDGKIVKNEDVTASSTMLEGIKFTDWDIITIQQNCANSGIADRYTRLDAIIDYVDANKTNKNAKLGWHMTWGARENSSVLAEFYPGKDQMGMYEDIVATVKSKVETNDKIDFVVPAGTAVQNARAVYGDTFNSDEKHLNAKGNTIACLTWLATITGNNLENITYMPDSKTTAEEFAAYKKAALNAVKNPYQVTK